MSLPKLLPSVLFKPNCLAQTMHHHLLLLIVILARSQIAKYPNIGPKLLPLVLFKPNCLAQLLLLITFFARSQIFKYLDKTAPISLIQAQLSFSDNKSSSLSFDLNLTPIILKAISHCNALADLNMFCFSLLLWLCVFLVSKSF